MNNPGRTEGQSQIIQEHCQDVFDVGYWECDPAAETVRCDPIAREMLGVEQREELTLETWLSILHPKDRAALSKRLREVMTTGGPLDREVRIDSENGTEQVLHLRATVDENHLRGIIRNVTEQQAQKQVLERAETIFETTQEALFVIKVQQKKGNETRFVFDQVNEEYEHRIGVKAEDIEGNTPKEVFGDTQAEVIISQCRECVAEQAVCQFNEEIERDGKERTLETRLAPVVVDGNIKELVGTARDVTNQKTQEQELGDIIEATFREGKEKTIFTQGPVIIFKWKNDDEAGWPITYVSENVEELFGYSPEELYAEEPAYDEIIHDDDLSSVRKEVRKCCDAEVDQFQHDPYRIMTADGEIRWVLDCTKNVCDEEGNVIERIGYIVDITGQKEREVTLNQAETVAEFGTWKWGTQTDENWWSDGMYDIFEQSRDEGPLTYEEILHLIHPNDRKRVQETWENSTENTYSAEFRLQIDETVKWIEAQCVRNFDSTGDVAYSLGVFSNITERKQRDQRRDVLMKTGRELLSLESSEEVIDKLATATADAFDATASEIYLHEEETGNLVLETTAGGKQQINNERIFTPDDEAWNAYANQTTISITQEQDNSHSERDASEKTNGETSENNSDQSQRQETVFSLGTHGVLVLTHESQPCSEHLLDIITILAGITGTVLDRINRVSRTQTRNKKLSEEVDTLEQQIELHRLFLMLLERFSTTSSADDIRQATCDILSTMNQFDGVLIGRVDIGNNDIEPTNKHSIPTKYIEDALKGNTMSPASHAVADQSPFNCPNIAKEGSRNQWQNTALAHGFQSVVSIPIRCQDILFGVLTIYSRDTNVFNDQTTTVLDRVGQFVGFALRLLEYQDIVNEEQVKKVVLSIDPKVENTNPLYSLCCELPVSIDIKSVTKRHENSHIVHAQINNSNSETIEDAAATVSGIEQVKTVGEGEDTLYEIVIIGGSIPGKALRTGAELQSITIAKQSCEIVYTLPNDSNTRRFSNKLKSIFDSVDIKAKYDDKQIENNHSSNVSTQLLGDTLTEQQQTILRTAYHSGYFDANRKQTGGDIAESLGIAQPTFSKHLRKAERNILEAIFE